MGQMIEAHPYELGAGFSFVDLAPAVNSNGLMTTTTMMMI